jgi:CRP-like cAMP-binding protein
MAHLSLATLSDGTETFMHNFIQQNVVQNRLLQSMSAADFDFLAPHLEAIELPVGLILEVPGEPVETVVFMESGIASRIVVGGPGAETECGHVGFEGMTGKPVVLGGDRAINRIEIRVRGTGLRIPAGMIKAGMENSSDFRRLMNRYVLACEIQTEHTLLSATSHTINQRLARWLLMFQDRSKSEELAITHDVLSDMLNVRRSSITDEIHILEGNQAIKASRGVITIRSRTLLLEIAGSGYGIPEMEYDRLIPFGAAASATEVQPDLAG